MANVVALLLILAVVLLLAGAIILLMTRRRGRIVREGFVVGVANPKVIIFLTAILPQFVDPDRSANRLHLLS